jgi:hypothetical protein
MIRNVMKRLLARATCALFGHSWYWHGLVRDWFCNRCRTRRRAIGVNR